MTAPAFPSHPNPSGSSYNQDEIKYWDQRLAAIEQLLEIDQRQAGLQLATAALNAANGLHNVSAPANMETLAAAAAISVSKLSTVVSAASGAFTLAAPAVDGQLKTIKMTVTNTCTVSGTNVQGQAGKSAHFSAAGRRPPPLLHWREVVSNRWQRHLELM